MQLKSVHPVKMQSSGGAEGRANGGAFISSDVLASVTSTARDYLRGEHRRVVNRGEGVGKMRVKRERQERSV